VSAVPTRLGTRFALTESQQKRSERSTAMKTAVSLIFWTTFGALALTFAFTGHAFGWIGAVIAGVGIKQALWPSKDSASSWFNVDAGGCGSCGGCGGCGD